MQHRIGKLIIETSFVGRYRSTLRTKDGELLACGESTTGWADACRTMSRVYQELMMPASNNVRTHAAVA
jgi:hypothetical protein